MKSGTMSNQGEIVIIPFPFTDFSSIKQRPALVISNNQYNARKEDIIVCGITSNPKNNAYSVDVTNSKLESGTILVPSKIKADKIYTIKQELIRKQIGKLNEVTFISVKKEVANLINS